MIHSFHLTAIALVSVLVSGCSSNPLVADTSLVQPYRFEMEKERQLQVPYAAKYHQAGKQLWYLAVSHLSSKESANLLEHPTTKAIQWAVSELQPQVIVVEGITTGDEISPKSVLNYADKCAASSYQDGCGESFFAINKAREIGADYISGEPAEPRLRDEIMASGYSIEDILGFYLVRNIPQLKRNRNFSEKTFPAEAQKILKWSRFKLQTEVKFDLEEFSAWYAKYMANPKSYLDIENNDPAPDGGPNATYIQKISHTVGIVRDRAVVKTVERILNQYDRVLVVYGASHFLTQEPVFTKMLGPAIYATP
jgi:hypothetical protein